MAFDPVCNHMTRLEPPQWTTYDFKEIKKVLGSRRRGLARANIAQVERRTCAQ
jgi:hypothetical protein